MTQIGSKLPKPCPQSQWMEVREWVMTNNCMITDKGDYYEVEPVPGETIEEKKTRVKAECTNLINNIFWRVQRYDTQKAINAETSDTEQTYKDICRYLQYLRDYDDTKKDWYENSPKSFEEWLKTR